MVTRLVLVRHGQAVVNVEPIIGGMKGDTGLTARGVRQAELLRDRIASCGGKIGDVQPEVLVASTLPRARQTAEIIAPALGLPVQWEDELHELRVGPDGDGLTVAEYRARFGWIDFVVDPLRPVDPNGESWATFMARVASVLTRITQEHAGKTIVAVCHGGVIDGSFLHFFGMNPAAVPPAGFATENTSLTVWEYLTHHGRMQWRLNRYNDAAHLRGPQGERLDTGSSFAENAPAATTKPAEPAPPTE